MAKYEGHKDATYGWRVKKERAPFRVKESLKDISPTPDEFAWGYGGSGPANLALALLLDVGLPVQRARTVRVKFMWDVVAKWDMEGSWKITTEDITKWIANNV